MDSLVSIVIPARNAAHVIAAQLEALARQRITTPWEVVVVDHGSTDATAAVARGHAASFAHLQVLDGAGLSGIPAVRNAGVRASGGDLLVHLDADDVVADGWLDALVESLRSHALVTGPLEMTSLNDPAEAAWRADMPLDRPPSWHGFHPAALTCNLGVARGLHDDIGGFREQFRSGSDIDFVWRAQELGYPLTFAPGAVVHRRLPVGARKWWRRNVRYGRYEPLLYREHAAAGMPRSSVARAAATWGWLAFHTPDLLRPGPRYRWLAHCGDRVGRLIGSVEQRRLYL